MAPPRRPDPAPLETDDARVLALGTAAWAAALIGCLVFRSDLGAAGRGWWVWACVAGVLLGLVGVRHCRRRQAAIARDRARSS